MIIEPDNRIIWPPPYRCENCGWWRVKQSIFNRWTGGVIRRLGDCLEPHEPGLTYRSHTCRYHTDYGRDPSGVMSSVRISTEMPDRIHQEYVALRRMQVKGKGKKKGVQKMGLIWWFGVFLVLGLFIWAWVSKGN